MTEIVAGCCEKERKMMVNGETLKVLEKQLKWLPERLSRYVAEIYFQVVDLNTLSLNSSDLSRFEEGYASIGFYTQDGELLGHVGRREVPEDFGPQWFWRLAGLKDGVQVPVTQFFREDVAQALTRLAPRSLETQYILHMDCGPATLYKVPKGTKITVHLALKSDEASQKLAEFISNA